MQPRANLLTPEEKAIIDDLKLLHQAADAATNLQLDEAKRVRRCLFERMRAHLLHLESLTLEQLDPQEPPKR